jgi:hypothetical protein
MVDITLKGVISDGDVFQWWLAVIQTVRGGPRRSSASAWRKERYAARRTTFDELALPIALAAAARACSGDDSILIAGTLSP